MKTLEANIVSSIVNIATKDPFEWIAVDAVELKLQIKHSISLQLQEMESKGWVEVVGREYWKVRVTQKGINEYCRVSSMEEPDEGTRNYNEFWSTTP